MQTNSSYQFYIASKVNNIIVTATLSDGDASHKEFLEQELIAKKTKKTSDNLIEFYRSINFDIDENSHLLDVQKSLSSVSYNQDDLTNNIQRSTNPTLSSYRF